MGQLLRFPTEQRKCPVGKLAYHPSYGVCCVVGAEGFKRMLAFERSTVTVEVQQLRPIDPSKDLAW